MGGQIYLSKYPWQSTRHHVAPKYTQSDEVRNSGPPSTGGIMLILPNKPIHVKTQNVYTSG